jgi:hypothetical protein
MKYNLLVDHSFVHLKRKEKTLINYLDIGIRNIYIKKDVGFKLVQSIVYLNELQNQK